MKSTLRSVLMTVIVLFGCISNAVPVQAATTLTLQVNAAGNNAVEDGTTFSASPSPLWVGNGASAASSFTGLRFTNLTIPPGATITSAKVSLYSNQSQWINLSFSIAAEAAANSAAFSSTSKMSQRVLTSAQVQHSDNVQWLANTWYTLDEIAPVIQQVVNQSGWQSGNSLSIILKGTGSAYARKIAASFNSSPANAPKLTITYDAAAQMPTATGLPASTATATATATSVPTTSTQSPTSTQPVAPSPTTTPLFTWTATSTLVPTATPTPLPSSTSTPVPSSTLSPTATSEPSNMTAFPVGAGGTDVNTHMIVRTLDDRVYIVVFNGQYTRAVNVYWTTTPGIPSASTAFNGSFTFQDSADIIGVDAVYDGANTIHILTNNQSSQIKDWPFDITTNSLRATKTIATNGGQFPNGGSGYTGTEGIVGMIDRGGKLHVAYWSSTNHIVYAAFSYDAITDVLSPVDGPTQVDGASSASHPALAVSPVDDSVTVAWVSHTSPAQILSRTKPAVGNFGTILTVSSAPVWTSSYFGIDIDQGPSLVIDQSNRQHLTYIENYDASGDYGRIHYVTNPGSGWVDQALPWYTHNPSLSLSSNGDVTIFGHGHLKNVSGPCLSIDDMCFIKKPAGGAWQSPQVLLQHSGTASFDTSPSSKWSVVGWNRPETLELVFSMVVGSDYHHPTTYYGQISSGDLQTPTPIPSATQAFTPTPLPSDTPLPTATDTPVPTLTPPPPPTETPMPTATELPIPPPTVTLTPTETSTLLPSDTPTPLPTDTSQPTATLTPLPTDTPTPLPTDIPRPTATETPVPTDTPMPLPTDTPQPIATLTPLATDTPTPLPTDTPQPTATLTPLPTDTPTPLPTDTSQPTATETPVPTDTPTPLPTDTSQPTATQTPIPTNTPTTTSSPTRTPTRTPTPTATPTRTPTPTTSVLLGATSIGSMQDNNPGGLAEAFTYTASASGTANKLSIYIDNSAATQVVVGLYSNTASNTPGTLLTSGIINNPTKGGWNSVTVPGVGVTSGAKYWLAVLSPSGKGTVRFRDVSSGAAAQVSSQTNLTALPAAWSPGKNYKNSPLSAYAQQAP